MIAALILRNFKCLDDVRLPLGNLTVLSGLNGMGKSSVLQSLLLLQQSHLASPDKCIANLVLNGELTNLGNARDALWEGAERGADDSKERISIGISANGQDLVWAFEYDEKKDELAPAPGNPAETPGGIGLFTDSLHYLRAERTGPRVSFPISTTAVREHRQFGRDGEYAPFFLSQYGSEKIQNDAARHPSAQSSQLRHQVEAWLSEISPGTRIYTEAHPKLDLVGLEFAFASGTGETNRYRPTNVGFGITYTLPIIVAALAAKPGTLILLENPEAHLHPRGQLRIAQLLGLCALGGIQIIAETHSDHFLNGLRLAVHDGAIPPESLAVHFFDREVMDKAIRAKITSPKIDRAGRIDIWPDGFFDETDKALRRLLVPPKS
jgi:predicted ATPase